MPCRGPSDAECRMMEQEDNLKKFGVAWDRVQLERNAACAFAAHVRHRTPLPKWASLWAEAHELEDRVRAARKKREQVAKEAKEYAEFVRLARKFRGKSGGK